MRFSYPYSIEDDEGAKLVQFVDVPEAHTYEGEDLEDCLVCALGGYVDLGRPIPKPSPARGRPTVTLPPLVSAKLALYEAMRDQGISKAALARRFGLQETTARRLVDLDHRSHIDQVAKVLAGLGRRIEVRVLEGA